MRPSGRLDLTTEAMGNHLTVQPRVSIAPVGEKRREPEATASSSDDQRSSKGGADQELDLECVLCGEISSDKTQLQRHLLSHTDFGYFDCSRCSSSFVEKNEYEEHMAMQHPSASGDGQHPSSHTLEPATTTNRHDIIVIGDDSDNDDAKCPRSDMMGMDHGTFQCEGESQLKIVNTMTLNPDVRSAPIVIDDDDDASSTSTVEWKGNLGDNANLDKSQETEDEPQDNKVAEDVSERAAKDDGTQVTQGSDSAPLAQDATDSGSGDILDEKSGDSDNTPKPDGKLESADLNLDVDLSEAFSDSDCLQIADYFMVVSETSRDAEDDEDSGNAAPEVEKEGDGAPDELVADLESNRDESNSIADQVVGNSTESGNEKGMKRTRSESPSQPDPEPKRTDT